MSSRTADRLVRTVLLLIGLLNVAPAAIALLPERIGSTYGVSGLSADAVLMMRHRAVLLGLVGAGLLLAVWLPRLRIAAIGAAAVSKVSFIALVFGLGANDALTRVAWIDVAALALIGAAAVLVRRVRP